MPSLWNINGLGNLQNKRLLSNLSFQLGESFSGRISAVLEDGTVNIKLLEGWMFNAVLAGDISSLPDGIVKFSVQGYEEEKLILQLVGKEAQEESREPVLSKYIRALGLSSEDEQLVDMLIKHNISLSKDKVKSFKGLLDIRDNAQNNKPALDAFVSKYLTAKGIEAGSLKWERASKLLKEAFELIGDMDNGDILTFIENEIPFTKENIKSYQEIFKGWGTISDDIMKIKKELTLSGYKIDEGMDRIVQDGSSDERQTEKTTHETAPLKSNEVHNSSDGRSLGYVKGYSIKEKGNTLAKLKELVNGESQQLAELALESTEESNLIDSLIKNASLDSESKDERSEKLNKKNTLSPDSSIKLQLKEGSRELKKVLESLIGVLEKGGQELPGKLHSLLLEKRNDFKLLNDISKEYYYLDIPVKLHEKDYPIKLLIKDSRKKGKQLDSKNIKLIVSIATANLGVVDGFIQLSGKNLKVTIGTGGKWVKILEEQKHKLQLALLTLGYNTDIFVTKKQEDATISNSRSFFNHNLLAIVDVLV